MCLNETIKKKGLNKVGVARITYSNWFILDIFNYQEKLWLQYDIRCPNTQFIDVLMKGDVNSIPSHYSIIPNWLLMTKF